MSLPFALLVRAICATGGAAAYQNPMLLLHLDGTAQDAGPNSLTTAPVGVSYTSQYMLAGQAAYFSASTDGIYVTSDLFDFGADDFCIEGFWRHATNIGAYCVFSVYTVNNTVKYAEFELKFTTNSAPKSIGVTVQTGSALVTTTINGLLPGSYTTNTRHHWAFYRIGDVYYVAVNGSVAVATTQSGRRGAGQRIFKVGNNTASGSSVMGSTQPIDEIRVTRGAGQIPYGASNFAPPSVPFA